jgi:hypothetical protein
MTSNFLSQIKTGKEAKPRRCLLYGTHGVGKSTWASQAPNPIFIQTEDGLDDLGVARFSLAKTFDAVMDMLTEINLGEHKFKTLVIDSVDWLEKLIWQTVVNNWTKTKVTSIDEIDYWHGYKLALTHWTRFKNALDIIREKREMNIVLISHCKVEKYNAPDGVDYDRYCPSVYKTASAYLQEWADEVFFCKFKSNIIKSGSGFNEKEKAIGEGRRVIYTNERPAYLAKNRLGIKDNIEMTWEAYQGHFSNGNNAKTTKGDK